MDLGALVDRFAASAGVVGVDSGLSHIAVALAKPHVQIYNFDTAWRTGPVGAARQASVFAAPAPTVDQVWAAWQRASAA
jgi:heptosyltransferase-1